MPELNIYFIQIHLFIIYITANVYTSELYYYQPDNKQTWMSLFFPLPVCVFVELWSWFYFLRPRISVNEHFILYYIVSYVSWHTDSEEDVLVKIRQQEIQQDYYGICLLLHYLSGELIAFRLYSLSVCWTINNVDSVSGFGGFLTETSFKNKGWKTVLHNKMTEVCRSISGLGWDVWVYARYSVCM